MPVATIGSSQPCEVCGTVVVIATYSDRRRLLEWPYEDDGAFHEFAAGEPVEHAPDRCIAARRVALDALGEP